MNKTQKRQLNLRNKLFAAIAMLLVSSIMMVSTTYAWFTLSTAPEVQGITTTVGANGNLEIALSPADGSAARIGSAMGDSNLAWTAKNTTWGNLLNLSDESYGLAGITLLPSRLNVSAVGTTPLKTPVYGADGRVQKLEANSAIGKLNTESATTSYVVDTAYRGVRAIGTSSSLTKYQITFNNYLAAMGQDAAAARENAEISLKNNGSKLAEMAMAHASAGSDDGNNYVDYKAAMADVITNLKAANAKLKDAIRDAFIATAASAGSNDAKYTGVMALVDAEPTATLEALMKHGELMAEDGTVSGTDAISEAYKAWSAIETKLASAQTEYDNLGTDVTWNNAVKVMNYLMATEGIHLNGYSLNEFKVQAKRFISEPKANSDGTFTSTADYPVETYAEAKALYEAAQAFMKPFTSGGTQLQLGAGSGVYADIAAMVGNLNANVEVDVRYEGGTTNITLPDVPIAIKTTTATSDAGHMGSARTALASLGAFTDDTATATGVLNETYGYIVDFFFRTNASNSSLLLQTDPAQRVYENGNSDATLGNGSSMTFRTGNIDGNAVQNLMACIRVVFLDTDSGKILGIASLDMDNATQKVVTAATETTAEVVDITAKLYLHASYTDDATTGLTLGDRVTNKNNAVLCELPANTAKAVSAMVYLDGDRVTNADVANAATSTTGTLNLQFASSAELVPMDNEALKNMAAEATTTPVVTPDETTTASEETTTPEETTVPSETTTPGN